MKITISGPPGSGKTTVAKGISESLGYAHVSAGDAFRQLAHERCIDLGRFSVLAESDPEIDRTIDRIQAEIANRYKNVVVEGRLSGWVIKSDLTIWLKAPLEVRVQRIAQREDKSYEQALTETRLRENSEAKRFLEIYNIDVCALDVYDLILDTQHWNQRAVIDIILVAVKLNQMFKK